MIWHRKLFTKRFALTALLLAGLASSTWAEVYAPSQAGRDLLDRVHRDVRAYFLQAFEIEVKVAYAVVAASDRETLLAQIQAARKAQGKPPRTRPIGARSCPAHTVGGAANRTFIALCWHKPPAQVKQADAASVMAHEYAHQLQYDLANDRPARRVGGAWLMGPAWMVEGTAEVFEHHFDTRGAPVDGVALFELQTPARRSRLTLGALHKTGSLANWEAYGVARFAAFLLAGRFGPQALFDYFRQLGVLEDQEAAFKAAFGVEMTEFEADFEAVRRDFGAAKAYVRMR